MRLRAIYNKKFGQWVICHNLWCKQGETSIIATVTTSLDEKADGEIAEKLCERWNMVEDALNENR